MIALTSHGLLKPSNPSVILYLLLYELRIYLTSEMSPFLSIRCDNNSYTHILKEPRWRKHSLQCTYPAQLQSSNNKHPHFIYRSSVSSLSYTKVTNLALKIIYTKSNCLLGAALVLEKALYYHRSIRLGVKIISGQSICIC